MYRTTIDFHKRLARGEVPVFFILIHTDMGVRAYAKKELVKTFEVDGGNYADGSVIADGSATAGLGLGLIEKSARVISFGSFEHTISPQSAGLLGGYQSKQLQHFSVVLNNADLHFSRILPKEPLLAKPLALYAGFEAAGFASYLKRFEGLISELRLTSTQMTLEADEQ